MKEMSLFHLVFGPAFIIRKWNNWKGWWISPQPSLLLSHEDEQAPYPKHKDVTFRRARDKLKSRPGAIVAPCLLFSSFFINNQYSGPRRDPSSRTITRVIWEETFFILFFSPFLKIVCIFILSFLQALRKDGSGKSECKMSSMLKGEKVMRFHTPKWLHGCGFAVYVSALTRIMLL